MLLEEMSEYEKGLNVDRLIAFSSLIAFIKVMVSSRGYVKKKEFEGKNLAQPANSRKLKSKSPFTNLSSDKRKVGRSGRRGFSNLR
jgi:hypothetical protein